MIRSCARPGKAVYVVYDRLSHRHNWQIYTTRDDSWLPQIRTFAPEWGAKHRAKYPAFQVSMVRMVHDAEGGLDIPDQLPRNADVELLFG